ncbi:MAG TPA: TrkA C-terminal domain-containing protein [Nitrospiraceae bacterium]|jgi:hypothetical protein|nr:TrkA C-terminal domain-containing protein [Nitrospiraceae bacterium]
MPRHFLNRARKEFRFNVHGMRETILALSERVNRKVQVLKLGWQAAELSDQVEAVYQRLGQDLALLLANGDRQPSQELPTHEARLALTAANGQLGVLRNELVRIDGLVRELETEVLRDDLLKLQQDLTSRMLGLERLMLPAGSPASGHSCAELSLPGDLHIVAVFRGPTVLDRPEQSPLRDGDIVIVLGPRAALKTAQHKFVPPLSL